MFCLGVALSAVALAAAPAPLRVQSATVMAVPPSIRETSAFVTLKNPTRKAVVIVGVQTPVAAHSMLMTTRKVGDMLGMSEVKTLTVPANGTLKMSATGDHLMLMHLRRPLKVGETLSLTLKTLDGRTLVVRAKVNRL